MSALDELGGWPALLTELIEKRDLPATHAAANDHYVKFFCH